MLGVIFLAQRLTVPHQTLVIDCSYLITFLVATVFFILQFVNPAESAKCLSVVKISQEITYNIFKAVNTEAFPMNAPDIRKSMALFEDSHEISACAW